MSLHIMARKHREKKGISSGGQFSTMGVRRYHYYTGQNRLNQNKRCVKPVGTVPLKAPKTTSGLISTRVHFPTEICEDGTCAKYNWVKSFNPEEHAQSNYIHKLKIKSACNDHPRENAGEVICGANCSETTFVGGKKKSRSTFHKNKHAGAMDAAEYINIHTYRKKCLPTPPCKAPFPFVINQRGCNIWIKTPEEAIDAGFLPSDWMQCTTDIAFKSY